MNRSLNHDELKSAWKRCLPVSDAFAEILFYRLAERLPETRSLRALALGRCHTQFVHLVGTLVFRSQSVDTFPNTTDERDQRSILIFEQPVDLDCFEDALVYAFQQTLGHTFKAETGASIREMILQLKGPSSTSKSSGAAA
ncbi:hypothetical protein [Pelagicoccus sp. SDUM812003]|uniref:hypothetical protein n=1 Tax=Pelagicoccus sp. SDUM812003 TaxID=3041267 RepID=UPI00280D86B7|nr:hypothetical protein [Pelagicoccus sp. SDUM812003]MDQ8203705.1 hypothetical protein [Pelagicoccus sp. SDUM812003]